MTYRLHIFQIITDSNKDKLEPEIIKEFKSVHEAFSYFLDNYKDKDYTCLVFDDLGRQWFVKDKRSWNLMN